ncbi:hypothetical protein BGZ63DRAFT_465563 [Mariannaea sp. PMI_226]|nr:hypothetical protein BGZ63DRAFT_465563 [Mariannaea sp. PMI_226]
MNRVPTSSRRVVKPGVKRRRPPLACIQCYQRKLKCGRELPSCSRCSKAGIADECTYRGGRGPPSSTEVNGTDSSSGTADAVTESLRAPALSVAAVGASESERRPASSDGQAKMAHLDEHETVTKFYGYSYPLNFYQQFTELRPYIIQIKTDNPSINALRDDIYSVPTHRYRYLPVTQDTALGDTLRQLIPKKPIADALVQTYIDRFEIVHRVFDIPAFITAYNNHWANPLCTQASFLSQLLLVVATAASFHSGISIDVDSSKTVHDHALAWVDAAETWLGSPANPSSRSSDNLASHCLLLIAKRANYIQEGSFWTQTGALVRRAMAAGYHREATSTVKMSPYYREMRRRLWMTIIELDLQASIERGMPTNVRIGDFNTISPLNIDDDKLPNSIQDSPKDVPLTTLTNTSFQVLLYRSLPVRLKICAFVNGCCEQDDFDQVLQLEGELGQALQDIPEWTNPQADPRQQQTAMYLASLLRIVLHQYAIVLHIQFSIQVPPSSKSAICRRARLEASMKILDLHQKLLYDEIIPAQACRTGLVLAALNICHEIYMNFGPHSSEHSATMTIFPEISTFLIATAEQVLQMLETRISETLKGLNEYYILSMTIGLVKSKLWPESSAKSDKEAADRVTRICTILQTLLATIRQKNLLLDPGLPGLELSEDPSPLLPDSITELLSSMLPQDMGFINNNLDVTFFHM